MNAIANLAACIGVTIVTRIGKTFFSGFACHGMVAVWEPVSLRIGKTYWCYNCNTDKNENDDTGLGGQRVAGYRREIYEGGLGISYEQR